jgi:hypothetical protein
MFKSIELPEPELVKILKSDIELLKHDLEEFEDEGTKQLLALKESHLKEILH